jgi:hypothetical protein
MEVYCFNAANYDHYLSPKELATFTDMDLNGTGVTNLKGIEHFTSLTRLLTSGNKLWSIAGVSSPAC